MHLDLATVVLAIVCGIGAGMLAGLFGVGGGIIFVPTLVLVFAFTQLDAQATSLAAIIPVAIVGAWRQTSEDFVYWRGALIMGIGAAAGVLVGAEIATRLPDHVLSQVFGAVLLLVGGEMIVRSGRKLRARRLAGAGGVAVASGLADANGAAGERGGVGASGLAAAGSDADAATPPNDDTGS